MKFSEYRAHPGTNITTLLELLKSPAHYRHARDHGKTDTTAMRMGRLYHLAILEPDEYEKTTVVWDGGRRGTNAYKEFVLANEGKQILSMDEHTSIMTVAVKMLTHPVTSKLLESGETEQTILWKHRSGRECKSRLDLADPKRQLIVDLKGAKSCLHWDFSYSVAKLRYMTQAAFYRSAFESKYEKPAIDYILIAFEKVPPYAFGVYRIDEFDLDKGVEEYERLLSLVANCEKDNDWSGPTGEKIENLIVPPWAYRDDDSVIIDGEAVSI